MSSPAIWREARNGHGEIGVLLYELVAQTVGLRILRPSGKLAYKRLHSGSREACTEPGAWTVRSAHHQSTTSLFQSKDEPEGSEE
jgi:hypothetical protein